MNCLMFHLCFILQTGFGHIQIFLGRYSEFNVNDKRSWNSSYFVTQTDTYRRNRFKTDAAQIQIYSVRWWWQQLLGSNAMVSTLTSKVQCRYTQVLQNSVRLTYCPQMQYRLTEYPNDAYITWVLYVIQRYVKDCCSTMNTEQNSSTKCLDKYNEQVRTESSLYTLCGQITKWKFCNNNSALKLNVPKSHSFRCCFSLATSNF